MFSNAITFIESRKDGVFIFVPEEKKNDRLRTTTAKKQIKQLSFQFLFAVLLSIVFGCVGCLNIFSMPRLIPRTQPFHRKEMNIASVYFRGGRTDP